MLTFTIFGFLQSTPVNANLDPNLFGNGTDTSRNQNVGQVTGNVKPYSGTNNADWNLSADPTFSDLYASIIFTHGTDTVANGAALSYEEIERYGVTKAESDTKQPYGQLIPHTESTLTGKKLSSYLRGLHKYNWLVTLDKEDNLLETAWDSYWGSAKGGLMELALNTAAFGAQTFEVFSNTIVAFGAYMQRLDIPQLFGYAGTNGDSNNIIHRLLDTVFTRIGFDKEAIRAMQYIFWTFIIVGGILGTMTEILKLNMRSAVRRFGRIMLRFATIVITLQATTLIQNGINELTSYATDDFRSADNFNQQYIINSLDLAITTNLDPTVISGKSLWSSHTDFAPDQQKIADVNETIKARKIASGLDDTSSKPSEILTDLAQSKRVSVNEYLIGISQAKNSAINASYILPVSGNSSTPISAGEYFHKSNYSHGIPNNVYFLSANGDVKVSDNHKTVEEDYKRRNSTSGTTTSPEDAEKYSHHTTYNLSNGEYSITIPFSISQSAFKFTKVEWFRPSTYIYGASTDNSEASGNFKNFINGRGTLQNNNPMTGEDFESSIDVADNMNADDPDGLKRLKKAMNTNSLMIALYNRYGGVSDVHSTLSTQSTAFILQTNITNNGIKYEGYNTTYTDTDKGKPSASDGATFSEYTIPSNGYLDMMGRIGAINLTWLLAGVCSILAFMYLLKAPMLSATFKMITSFLRAMLTGNLVSLLQYAGYYAAIQFSFSFALISIYMSTQIGSIITDKLAPLASLLTYSPDGILTASANSLPNVNIPSLGTIFIAIGMSYVMCWPIFNLKIGRKTQKVGLVGIIVMIPYLMAMAFDEYLDTFERILYGRSHNQNFFTKLGRTVEGVDQGKLLKDKSSKLLKTGLQAGAALATGGVSAAGQFAAKMAAGKAINAALGGDPTDPENQYIGDEEERSNSMLDKLGGFGTAIKNYRAGDEEFKRRQEEFNRDFDTTEEDMLDYENLKGGLIAEEFGEDFTPIERELATDLHGVTYTSEAKEEMGHGDNIITADSLDKMNYKAEDTNLESDSLVLDNEDIKVEPLNMTVETSELDSKLDEIESKKVSYNKDNSDEKSRDVNQNDIHDELVDIEKAILAQDGKTFKAVTDNNKDSSETNSDRSSNNVSKDNNKSDTSENNSRDNNNQDNNPEAVKVDDNIYRESKPTSYRTAEKDTQMLKDAISKARQNPEVVKFDEMYGKAKRKHDFVDASYQKQLDKVSKDKGESKEFLVDQMSKGISTGNKQLDELFKAKVKLEAPMIQFKERRDEKFLSLVKREETKSPERKQANKDAMVSQYRKENNDYRSSSGKIIREIQKEKVVTSTKDFIKPTVNAAKSVKEHVPNIVKDFNKGDKVGVATSLNNLGKDIGVNVAKQIGNSLKVEGKVAQKLAPAAGNMLLNTVNNLAGFEGEQRLSLDDMKPKQDNNNLVKGGNSNKSDETKRMIEAVENMTKAINDGNRALEDSMDSMAYDLRERR